jgi:hypothetical protein
MLPPGAKAGCIVLCVSATLCGQRTLAAEWRVSPSAYVGTSYADNPRLAVTDTESSAGAVAEFKTAIQLLTERSNFSLTPRWRSSRYDNDSSLDSDDQFVNARYNWVSERTQWNSEIAVTRDSTLTSEIGLTGLVESNRRHQAVSVSVGPTFMLTERTSVGGQLYSVDNHYDDNIGTGLVDYDYRAASLFGSYALSDRSSLVVTAQGGQLTAEGFLGGTATRDASLKLSWNYQPWDLWNLLVSAGPSYADSKTGSASGQLLEFETKRRGDLWSFSANGGRSLTPTGRGVMMRRDHASLTAKRMLAERFDVTVSAQWIRSEDLPQLQADTYYVDYGRIDLTGYWRVGQNWSLALQLSGLTQERESSTERADGYRALLSMVWNGLPLSL